MFYDYWIMIFSADKAMFWGMFGQFNHNFGRKSVTFYLEFITIFIICEQYWYTGILHFWYWEHFMMCLFINNMKYLWKTLGNVTKNSGHMSLLTNTKKQLKVLCKNRSEISCYACFLLTSWTATWLNNDIGIRSLFNGFHWL